MNSLEQQINDLNIELTKQLSANVLHDFQQSINDLQHKNISSNSINIGQVLPNFELENTNGDIISLNNLLQKNKFLIIAFYRGSWCPYCNLELKALQKIFSKITALNADLVAISPQENEFNLDLKNKHEINFNLLNDKDNTYAKKIGISFCLQDFIIPTYEQLGINLNIFNANNNNSLPIPAVFVVNNQGLVIYRFIDINYMNRVNLEDMLEFLSSQYVV